MNYCSCKELEDGSVVIDYLCLLHGAWPFTPQPPKVTFYDAPGRIVNMTYSDKPVDIKMFEPESRED